MTLPLLVYQSSSLYSHSIHMMFILGHSQAIVAHQRQATDRLLGRQTEGHRSRQEHLYHHQRIVVCVRSPSSYFPSYNQFEKWCEKNSFPLENVVNDQSMTNDTRLGAIADINLVLKSKKEQIGNSDGIRLLPFFPISPSLYHCWRYFIVSRF